MKITRPRSKHLSGLVAGVVAALMMPLVAPPAAADSATPGTTDGGAEMVRLVNGYLSLSAADVALFDVLNAVARVADFTLVPYVRPERRVDVTLDQVQLQQGLLTLLRQQSFVLHSQRRAGSAGSRPGSGARPQTLWLLPQRQPDESSSNEAAFDSVAAVLAGLRAILTYGATAEREEAAVALGHLDDARAIPPLAAALTDSATEVRRAVIESLAAIGGEDAASALAVALHDNGRRIREETVDALGDIGGVTAVALLQSAVTDEVAFVRQAALEALDRVRSTAR